MERPSTPPQRATRSTRARTPPTPEVTRRIEENRLKAKALRDQREASDRADGGSGNATARSPSGFFVGNDETHLVKSTSTVAGSSTNQLKRTHASISRDVPETQRDARTTSPTRAKDGAKDGGGGIQAARKFTKYVEYDFSKMTDTKGGFLSADDDPFNRALHGYGNAAGGAGGPARETKPEHMTLKEWEQHQLIRSLRKQKQGPYEPGLSVLSDVGKDSKCRECGSLEIDFTWQEVFGCAVCGKCKEKFPEKYSLLTKTEARDDYLLTEPELKDPELLPCLKRPNPHKSHWHDMSLYLRYQVEEYAFSDSKWGGAEGLDREYERRESERKQRKERKFRIGLVELKKRTRGENYRRGVKLGINGVGGDGGVGKGRHEHEWGDRVERADGASVKRCGECGMEVEELEF